MNSKLKLQIIEKLRDDGHYYGEFGKQFISNSDVRTLIHYPDLFKQEQEETLDMIKGRFFHTAVLEPEKLEDFIIVDASSRNTNIYRNAVEENGGNMLLLKKDADNLKNMIQALWHKQELYDAIKSATAYEEPQIAEIEGLWFKGKADIIHDDLGLVIDLKTTSDLKNFRRSAETYYYDSQAYIYRELFGYDVRFIAIDKLTKRIGVFDVSEDMYLSGRNRVQEAVAQYHRFYGENPEEDPQQYVHYEIL